MNADNTETTAVELKNIKINFNNRTVLDIPSLTFFQGEIISLVGHNGSGKSTLLKLIAGILQPESGSTTANGTIIYQPQYPKIFHMKAIENAMLGMRHNDKVRAEELLNRCGIKREDFEKRGDKLSGGQKQRVFLVRTLLADGEIILLDEPFASMDVQSKNEIEDMFFAYCREHKKTLILSSHSHSTSKKAGNVCIYIESSICKRTDTEEALSLYSKMN